MDTAYLHLLTNHVPILGTFFGVFLLLIAYFKPQLQTAFSAYVLMIMSGIGGLIAYFSGEGAEEKLEEMASYTAQIHERIHLHEEMAENTFIFIILLTAVSLLGLWSHFAKWEKTKQIQLAILITGLIAFILFAFTGYLGGFISHD